MAAGQGGVPAPQPAGGSSAPSAADPPLSPLSAAASAPSPDPSQGDDLRSTIIASGQPQPDPDVPAPGATPTGGTGLPPGVTMPSTPAVAAPAADAPSFDPEGTGDANYDPSAAPSLRDTIVAAATDPNIGMPGAALPSSGQADASPPTPTPSSGSPYGAMPSSMDGTPASIAGSNMGGAASLSSAGRAMSAMGLDGVDSSFVQPGSAGMTTGLSAAPLSTDNLPGFDSLGADGSVQGSSLGAAGFTGRDNATNPVTAATQGGLPGPQSYVGGDLGLGTSSSAPPAT